ncbi:uncharacterized protein Dwil_GK18890 [Drosophila willistoni]|uniref:Uncharacterized protein n=2 Tax=Drosophila willistoni TaxID=7260 RepID=B4N6F2_DROWI|nr:uncharacterized protein Dwil_GK18890 [Drosophila willistoni]
MFLMHNELRQLRSVLAAMLRDQEQAREQAKAKAEEKHRAKSSRRRKTPKRSKSSQVDFDDNPTTISDCPQMALITQQAQRIEEQQEMLHRIKLCYERQVANIKSNAQLLECQLNKLQMLLQAHLEQNPDTSFRLDSYYNEILQAVDKMQSHGINVYDSPIVSQSSSNAIHNVNSSLHCCSMESLHFVDNA